jgi:hypothetical protein
MILENIKITICIIFYTKVLPFMTSNTFRNKLIYEELNDWDVKEINDKHNNPKTPSFAELEEVKDKLSTTFEEVKKTNNYHDKS